MASIRMLTGHLDTVFPEGTDVKVKRDGTKFAAPGIVPTTTAASPWGSPGPRRTIRDSSSPPAG